MTALNLNNLRCFLTVVETGSISRAAKEGFVTQQAVSEQIRRLEQDFQTPLLERTRPVRLTAAGEIVYDTAKKVLAEVKDAEERVARLREPAPLLVISTGLVRTPPFLPGVIVKYQERWPEVEVRLVHHSSADEEADAPLPGSDLIVGNMPFAPGVEGTVLFQDTLCAAVSVRLLGRLYGDRWEEQEARMRNGITWEECTRLPGVRPVQLPAGRFCGPGRVNAAGLADMDLVLYRCSAGLEAALLPEHYARMAFAGSGDVCIFPIVPEIAAFQVGVGVWRDRPVSTAARAFIRLAREELAGM